MLSLISAVSEVERDKQDSQRRCEEDATKEERRERERERERGRERKREKFSLSLCMPYFSDPLCPPLFDGLAPVSFASSSGHAKEK